MECIKGLVWNYQTITDYDISWRRLVDSAAEAWWLQLLHNNNNQNKETSLSTSVYNNNSSFQDTN